MQFEFIELGDPNGPRKAKSHAVKHACRERRARDAETFRRKSKRHDEPLHVGKRLEEVGQIESTRDWQVGSQLCELHPPEPVSGVEASSTPSEGEPLQEDPVRWDLDEPKSETNVLEQVTRSGPETPKLLQALGGFGEGAISRLSRIDQYLLKWTLISLPLFTWQVKEKAPVDPLRDCIWSCAINSYTSLQATALFGSVYFTLFEGRKISKVVLERKAQLIRLINKNMRDPLQNLSDDMVFILTNVVLTENRIGNTAVRQVHLNGLMEMIRLRGGLESLNKNKGLSFMTAWMEIAITKPSINSKVSPFESMSSGRGRAHHMREAVSENEIFCQFLAMLWQQTQKRGRNDLFAHSETRSRQRLLFRKGLPYDILLRPEDQTTTSGEISNNCRIASLLYISFVLCESWHSPELTAALLRRLSILLIDHNLDTNPRPRLLIFVLYRDIEDGVTNCRFWRLVRAMRVVRRLSQDICDLLHSLLLDDLRYEEVADPVQHKCDFSLLLKLVRKSLA